MADAIKRVYGPRATWAGASTSAAYTAPSGPAGQRFHLRDITIVNPSSQSQLVKITISGSVFYRKYITANSTSSFRGLIPVTASQALHITQDSINPHPYNTMTVAATGAAASPWVSAAWTPEADTLYFLVVANTATDAPGAVSSTSGNGTWTSIVTQTTGSQAGETDVRCSAFYWYSEFAGSNATTTVNFASATTADGFIVKVPNVLRKIVNSNGRFSSIVQATGSTTSNPSGASANQPNLFTDPFQGSGGGILFAAGARTDLGTPTFTSEANYTDLAGLSANGMFFSCFTGPLADSTGYFDGGTWSTATADPRVSLIWEMAHDTNNNSLVVTVDGVEVS